MTMGTIKTELIELDLIHSDLAESDKQSYQVMFQSALEVLEPFLLTYEGLKWSALSIGVVSLTVTLCDDEKMTELNRDYRGKDQTTDVLSFPVHDSLRLGQREESPVELRELNLGDIIISKEVAIKQAEEFKISYHQEVLQLFIHGILHLIGFDHEISQEEENLMFRLEDQIVGNILQKVGEVNGSIP